jgi:Flp pilus assembly pilin Flp
MRLACALSISIIMHAATSTMGAWLETSFQNLLRALRV